MNLMLYHILEENINSTELASLIISTQNIIHNASSIIVMVDKDYKINETNFWQSIATSETSVELSNFQLSPQILFEAVMFELSVKMEIMDAWMAAKHWTKDGVTQKQYPTVCAELGCIISTPNIPGVNQDQVRLIPLCAGENEEEISAILYWGGYDHMR